MMVGDTYVNANTDFDLLRRTIQSSVLTPRYKYVWLNEDETEDEIIPEELIYDNGSYSENYQTGQRRSLSFGLNNVDGRYTPSINSIWAETKVGLKVGLDLLSGSTVWFPKGTYIINSANPTESASKFDVQLDCADKFSLLDGKLGTLETSYTIPKNSDIEGALRDCLLFTKGNGRPLDPLPMIYHSSFKGRKTAAKISHEAGDTIGDIVNDLVSQLGAECFYDVEGHLVVVPLDEVSGDASKPVLYNLRGDQGDFDNLSLDFKFTDIVNRIVVLGGSSESAAYKAIAVNDNVESPLCYQRIGYRTAPPISDGNLTSQYLVDERAQYELRKILILKSSVNLGNVPFNPLLSVNNLITITSDFFDMSQEKFLIQGINFNLNYDGVMSLEVSNTNNFNFARKGGSR